MTAATMAGILPIKVIGMFVALTKFIKLFDPARVQTQARRTDRTKRLFR